GWLAGIDFPLKHWMANLNGPARDLPNIWQYTLVTLLAFATAWITITTGRRHAVALLILAVIAELLTLSWVLSLYHVFFAPAPSRCLFACCRRRRRRCRLRIPRSFGESRGKGGARRI